ncbi:MAG TPA: hypothetical protein VMB50_02780 [Myxococcales bacterium]|nr:hypothetical protein [Myxococcales bacterium]
MKRLLFAACCLCLAACTACIAGCSPNDVGNNNNGTSASQSVGSAGATVAAGSDASVSISAGILTAPITVTIQPAASSTPAPANTTVVGGSYVFGPEGQQFNAPVTVTLAFSSVLMPAGASASSVVIMTAPLGSSTYTPLPTTVVDSSHVSAQTTHFSVFVPTVPTSSGSGTTGGTGGTGGTTGGPPPTCSPTNAACPATAPAALANATYPGGSCGTDRGSVFPDFFLGTGYWNTGSNGQPLSDIGLTSIQELAFHYLYCSGFKYAFLDISAVWCPHCNDEAAQLPGWNATTQTYSYNAQAQTGYAVKWLAEGGIILSVLEQGDNPSNAATPTDLTDWITKYNTNYPMAIDPEENLVSGVGLQAWPANIIIDLSNMKVVEAVFGDVPTFYQDFDNYLASGG